MACQLVSAQRKEIKSTAKHFPALQHQTELDGMLLLTYLGDYLNVESPGYQIISEETVNCTEWDLFSLWLSGSNKLSSKYEEQDSSDLHPSCLTWPATLKYRLAHQLETQTGLAPLPSPPVRSLRFKTGQMLWKTSNNSNNIVLW